MNINQSEWIWLNDQNVCSAQHLIEVSGLSNEELDELINNGIIMPVDDRAQQKTFFLHYVVVAKNARRLRDDFELDRHGLALALTLMKRINDLQEKLDAMKTYADDAT